MKFLPAQLSYLLRDRDARQSVVSLMRYVAFIAGVILLCTILFHLIMLYDEGREYSWVTGLYWTLTVMTTLGFGDITFQGDLGRLFSVLVLLSGVVLLLIVMPFVFIRLFFGPWLEAQVRNAVPREVPEGTKNHVILCGWDALTQGLAHRMQLHSIDHFVIDPDPVRAAQLRDEGVSVIAGEIDSRQTYEKVRASDAQLLVANSLDTVNTNIVLTARDVAKQLPILATADEEDSIDILELSGCTHVLALKKRLGEMLVNRINTGHAKSHVIGRFHNLVVAEFLVHRTGFAGRTLGETQIRESTGVTVIGIWEGGELLRAKSESVLTERSVLLLLATSEELMELDLLMVIYDTNYSPVVMIGGGKVGRAAVSELRRREFPVHVVDRDPGVCQKLEAEADRVVLGDAADRRVLERAGIHEAPAVLLTTNDDAVNIYLSIYCRKLNPDLRIVSRITHQRNVEAIYRAGADFVVSYSSLGVETVLSRLRGGKLVFLDEQVELFSVEVPKALGGKSIQASQLESDFELHVVAVQQGDNLETGLSPETILPSGGEMVLLGKSEERQRLHRAYL